MNALVRTLLAELDDEALAELARLIGPHLPAVVPPEESGLLTTAQAARRASVHPETIRRAIRNGALPVAGRVGRTVRLAGADIDAWVSTDGHVPRAARRTSTRRRTTAKRPLAEALAQVGDAA